MENNMRNGDQRIEYPLPTNTGKTIHQGRVVRRKNIFHTKMSRCGRIFLKQIRFEEKARYSLAMDIA